jgi:hypothetical protein
MAFQEEEDDEPADTDWQKKDEKHWLDELQAFMSDTNRGNSSFYVNRVFWAIIDNNYNGELPA